MTATLDAITTTGRRRVAATSGRSERHFTWLCVSVLVVFAAIWLIPLVWALDTSFRPNGDIPVHPTTWWGGHWTLHSYRIILTTTDMLQWYLNSAVIAVVTVVLCVLACSLAGFALSRTRFRGRRWMYGVILAGLMIPPQVLIIPLFQEFNLVHLLNTYWAVILPAVPTPVAVLVYASFFTGLPRELVEAARIDGASWLHIYRRIAMPLCKPATSAVAIFTFVWSWNNLLWPLVVLTSSKLMTIPVGLTSVQSSYGIRYADSMASAILGALPLIAVFLFFQRRIVEGIATAGIK